MDETKVQIGEEVLLDIGIHSEWYISSTGYDGESVDITLRKKADRIQKWWFSEEYSPDGKPCGLTLQSSDGRSVELVPAPKWIPCSERLPEEEGNYLVTFGAFAETINGEKVIFGDIDGSVSEIGYGCYERDIFWHPTAFGWYDLDTATPFDKRAIKAWMPLPEPYTADTPQTDSNCSELPNDSTDCSWRQP